MVETGHQLENIIPPIILLVFWRDGWQIIQRSSRCDPHRRDLSSVFMTVGNADTPRHPSVLQSRHFRARSSQLAARGSQLAARNSQKSGSLLGVPGDVRSLG